MDYLLIDAFARSVFTGNPAAVVFLERTLDDQQMQQLAMEFNQAETAFLEPLGDTRYQLRWFTPTREVELCGHATLAAAQALREWGRVGTGQSVRFLTRRHGEIACSLADERISMDFPATIPAPAICPPDILRCLGLPPRTVVSCIGTTAMNLTIRLPDEASVLAAAPHLETIASYHPVGVTITAPSSQVGVDVVSRFFAPNAGIPEDPVTGSAHCALAPYWAQQLGRPDFTAVQLSARRGWLEVGLRGERVQLAGQAFVTASGVLSDALFGQPVA